MMARSGGSSLLIPLILAFIIGLLLYFYWGASSQVVSLKTDNNGLKKELRAARNERDNLQYRLNLLREDLDVALQKKEEADRRFQEEEELVQGADAKIREMEDQLSGLDRERLDWKAHIKDLEEQKTAMDDELIQVKKELDNCEADKLQLKASSQTSQQQNARFQSTLQELQQDNQQLKKENDDQIVRIKTLQDEVRQCGAEQYAGNQPQDSLEDRVLKDLQGQQQSEEQQPSEGENVIQHDTPDLVEG